MFTFSMIGKSSVLLCLENAINILLYKQSEDLLSDDSTLAGGEVGGLR